MKPMTSSSEKKLNKRIRLTVICILIFISLVMTLFLNKMFSPRIMSDAELRVNGAIVFENPRVLSDFNLMDHNKDAFTLDRLTGHWTLIFYGFLHCPDICPTTLAELSRVYNDLDENIKEKTQVVLVTADPARDTPENLAQYVTYYNPSFMGLTGEFLDIRRLASNLNVAFNKVTTDDGYTIDHTGNVMLINPLGHYHGFFKPPFKLAQLKGTYQSIVSTFDPE